MNPTDITPETIVPRPNFIDFKPSNKVVCISNPDPSKNSVNLLFTVKVADLHRAIPKDPNPRAQKITTAVAKQIDATAKDPNDNNFHIINRGILMMASSVELLSTGFIRAWIPEREIERFGLADGGTSYEVLMDSVRTPGPFTDIVNSKHVRIEVIGNLQDPELQNNVVRAHNTSNQVKDSSIEDHKGGFDFIKRALDETTYSDRIAYKENTPGFKIEDLILMLTFLNPDITPMEKRGNAPVCHGTNIWGQKNSWTMFKTDPERYWKFEHILPQVLELFDYIGLTAAEAYNRGYRGHHVKAGSTCLFEKGKTPWGGASTPFTEECATNYPVKAFWFMMFGAFRSFVVEKNGRFEWKIPFDQVLATFDKVGHLMVSKTYNQVKGHGHDPDAMARSSYAPWELMYATLKHGE